MTSNASHQSREEVVLLDLFAHFPEFVAPGATWKVLARGEDPPDAIGILGQERIGLELTEWLNGAQMSNAIGRNNMRKDLQRILNWQKHPIPKNFQNVIVLPRWGNKVKQRDEEVLCWEFHQATHAVDSNWKSVSQWPPVMIGVAELQSHQILNKYIGSIQFLPGSAYPTQYGLSWIDFHLDGGAYDPEDSVLALCDRITHKTTDFNRPEQQARILRKQLDKTVLLVHGGFNQYAYNTPYKSPWKKLQDVALQAAAFCDMRSGPFDEIWMFYSLGESRKLFQLYPEFRSIGA